MRVPAPLMPLVWVGRPLLRRHAVRKTVKREFAKTDKRLNEALDARGLVAVESVAMVEPTHIDLTTVTARVAGFRSWAYRHRRDVFAPLGVALALVAARVFVQAVPSGWSWLSLAAALLPLVVVAGAGIWWVGQVGDSGKQKLAAILTVLLGLLWVASPARIPVPVWPHELTLIPFGSILGAVLPWWPLEATRWALLGAYTAVAGWVRWRRFRPRKYVAPKVGPAETWAATQGAEGRTLAGTRLVNVERVISAAGEDVGWSGTLLCIDGKHDTTKVAGQKESIGGSYGRDLKDVQVERTGHALQPRIAVMERDPFPLEVSYSGPSLDDAGVSRLGSFYDGEEARVRLWKPGAGTFDTWAIGKRGSGKTTAVDCLLGSWMSRGLVVGDMTDMKGGSSLPWWKSAMYKYGTDRDAGMLALQRADAVLTARTAAMKSMRWYAPGDPVEREGVSCLEPSLEWPVWLVILEEGPQLLRNPAALPLLERIMTLGRAPCVSVLYVSQMAELKQAFGNSSTIREQLQAGNVWAGYIGSSQADLGFDDFNPDLGALEKDSYRSYLTSPMQSRDAVMRVDYIKDSWAVARSSEPGTPNPVDAEAVREVEERAARDEHAVIAGEPAPSGEVTRRAVEAAIKRLSDAAGGPVTLGSIAQVFGDKDNMNLYDSVRNQVKNLMEDPKSPVRRQGWGKYAA